MGGKARSSKVYVKYGTRTRYGKKYYVPVVTAEFTQNSQRIASSSDMPTNADELHRSLLRAEHEQRMRFALIEHQHRMRLIESQVGASLGVLPIEGELPNRPAPEQSSLMAREPVIKAADLESIREALVVHLGTPEAADAWLNSTKTGYATTALDAILAGKAALVKEDLERQWGPAPAYA